MSKGTGSNFFHGMTTQELDPTKAKTNEAFYKVSKTLGKHRSTIEKAQSDRNERAGLDADVTADPQDETTKETSSFFRNFFMNWFRR